MESLSVPPTTSTSPVVSRVALGALPRASPMGPTDRQVVVGAPETIAGAATGPDGRPPGGEPVAGVALLVDGNPSREKAGGGDAGERDRIEDVGVRGGARGRHE